MSDLALRAAAWLLTYALHSTLLLCAAALLARRVRGEAWRETLWKAALVGGLVTATAQSVSGYRPPVGTWRLENAVEITASLPVEAPAPPAQPSSANEKPAAPQSASTASPQAATPRTPAATETPSATHTDSTLSFSIAPLVDLAVALWAVIAALLMVRIAWRQGRLRAMLRGRSEVADKQVLGMIAALRRNAGIWRPIRLTVCDAAPTPLALGGDEICVPPRFLVDLDPEEQRSALAHELAHLARRDPAWHFAVGMIESVFFFQPLNRLARLRLRESAEFLCDEWAARQTGSPLGLARCLAQVASWVAPGRSPIPAGTMAMAEGGSPLVQRVQRLTAWRGGASEASGVLRAAGAAALVLAVAVAAPAVASSGEKQAEAQVDGAGRIQTGAQEGIIRHPRPAEPLERRWEWAVAEIGRRGMEHAWIAYSVPAQMRPGHTWITDSDGLRLEELGRASVNQVVGAPEADVVMIFRVERDGVVKRVAGRSAAGFEFGRKAVLWLGGAEGDESVAQLRRLADGAGDPDLRESLVEAIGVHRGDAMVPYLAAVLGRDGSNGVRQSAAQALARHPGDEALGALLTAVERDGSKDVRREAVEGIGVMRHPRSTTVLRGMALEGRDAGIRRAAAEALGATGAADALQILRRVAMEGADAEAARQAVESMESYPAEQAAPLLEQIAWTGHAETARQATESLGRFPTPWALEALDSLSRMHPVPSVAQQAAESLGGLPGGLADGYLDALARTHIDPRVREEALDQLARKHRRADGTAPQATAELRAALHAKARADGAPQAELSIDPDPDP